MRRLHSLSAPSHPATVAMWLIDDVRSHPIWRQYGATLVHLRPEPGLEEAFKALPAFTHEFLCFALNPDTVATAESTAGEVAAARLWPPNMGYQFEAENDAAAMRRVEEALQQAPSLDTDWRSWWNARFQDGYPMVSSRFAGS